MYWKEEEQELCKIIATTDNKIEINKAFTKLYPKIEHMYTNILIRYYGGNPELQDEATVEDIFSLVIEKVYKALINKYDGVSSSFSFVQHVIKNRITDYFVSAANKKSKNNVDINGVDIPIYTNSYTHTLDDLLPYIEYDLAHYTGRMKERFILALNSIKEVIKADIEDKHDYLLTVYLMHQLEGDIAYTYCYFNNKKNISSINYYVLIRKANALEVPIEEEYNTLEELNDILFEKFPMLKN